MRPVTPRPDGPPAPPRPDGPPAPRPDGPPAPLLPAPPPVARAEWLGLAALCAVALGLRLWNVQQLHAHDPFFALPAVDGRMYHEWAQQIAAGDWLGDRVFLNGPLYPYALAGLYALVGPSLLAAKLAQALLGTLTCALTWALGRRVFAPGVALGGAAAVALSEMGIFFEAELLVANLLTPLALAAVLAALRAGERPGAGRWLAAGLWVGLGALARPNLLLFGGLVAGWAWLALAGHARARRAGWLAAFALGAALCVAPVTWRNYAVGGDFVPITYAGGLNLFLGNNVESDGSFRVPSVLPRSEADDPWEQREAFQSLAERAAMRPLKPSEVSRFWSRRAWLFWRARPADAARLLWRKTELVFNAFEPWNIRSLTLTREFSAVLRLPLLSFGWLAPLALVGLGLHAARWRALGPLLAWLATVFGTQLVFFVLARYRVTAFPLVALFAAAGAAGVAQRARAAWPGRAGAAARTGRLVLALGAPLAAAGACAGFAARDVAREDLSIAHYNLGNRWAALGEHERAIRSFVEAVRRRHDYVSAHSNLALAFEAAGRREQAERAWRRVRALGEAQGLPRYVERADRHLRGLAAGAPPEASEPAP